MGDTTHIDGIHWGISEFGHMEVIIKLSYCWNLEMVPHQTNRPMVVSSCISGLTGDPSATKKYCK